MTSRRRVNASIVAAACALVCLLLSEIAVAGTSSAAPQRPGADPARAASPVIVVAAGDIARCAPPNCAAARTARRVRANDPARVLTMGDNQYERGTLTEFRSQYAKSWGRFRGRTRPTPGNHEYLTKDAGGYFRYFGKQAHRRRDGYYSFNVRGWHVVALNSSDGSCSQVRCGPRSAQVRWLRRDLDEHKRRCTLAYWHHPPWSSGEHGGNTTTRTMWRVLARGGGDVVLNGHDHNYERFAPRAANGSAAARGIRQFIVGTGGGGLRSITKPYASLSRKRIDHRYGVLRLALRPRSYNFRFISAGGRVLDRGGRFRCH